MKKIAAILVIILFIFANCKKEEKTADSSAKLFTFNSLKADQNSIKQGDVTNISAEVTGDVTFEWSATSGDVFGSGKVVLFGASTCCVGNHDITCTVKDKNNNSESKTVSVIVTEK